jgi:hypothetical protein
MNQAFDLHLTNSECDAHLVRYSERLIQVRHITATITDLGNWFNGNGFVFGMICQIENRA